MQPTDPHRQPPPHFLPPQPNQPPPGEKPDPRLTLGDGVAAFGGLLVFAFSFAPFVSYDDAFQQQLAKDNLPTWFNAWSAETFMGPLTWFVVLAGLITIGLAAAHLVLPRTRELLGFRVGHLQIGVALFAFLVTFGYATSDKDVIFGHDLNVSLGQALLRGGLSFSFSWGGYLMLLGTVLGAAGAILSYLEVGPVLYPQPPRPVGYPPAPAGYPPPPQGGYPPPPPGAYPPPQPAPQPQPPVSPSQPTAQYPVVPPPTGQPGQRPEPPSTQWQPGG